MLGKETNVQDTYVQGTRSVRKDINRADVREGTGRASLFQWIREAVSEETTLALRCEG